MLRLVEGYNLQSNELVLIIWTNCVQKEYFQSKTAEMNLTIKPGIFILV